MLLPSQAQKLIDEELAILNRDITYDLNSQRRIGIYGALGESSHPFYKKSKNYKKRLPELTVSDRVRTKIALITAQKVLFLWETACLETDTVLDRNAKLEIDNKKKKEAYKFRLDSIPLEEVSVYEVPREFIPLHIIKMAKFSLEGSVKSPEKLYIQANEWWQVYPRPEYFEREYFIKWAAQEALYESTGLVDYERIPPARDAVQAFAGVFWGNSFGKRQRSIDIEKRNEFWIWWLSEAIPTAWNSEN